MFLRKDIEFNITEIKWERIFLDFKIETDYKGTVEFAFIRFINRTEMEESYDDGKDKSAFVEKKVKISCESCHDGKYDFSLNLAAVDGRSFLENGEWAIGAFMGEDMTIVCVTKAIAYKIDDLSRIFRYGRGKYAYNLSFLINNYDKKSLELYFCSYFMIQNRTWKRRRYIQEAFTFGGKLNRLGMYSVIIGIRIFYKVFSNLTTKNGTRVLFMSETKDYLWGNLKYINDRIIARGLDKRFKLSYSCRRAVGNHMSAVSWIKTVWTIVKQDYIFIDDYAPLFGFFKLNPRTKLIQVWHAGEGFKSVGYSRFGKTGSPFPSESCHKAYDYALTGSESLVKVYEEVFGIEKDAFLPVGMARLDDFLDPEKIDDFKEKFYTEYPAFKGKKIILFAPTFRGKGQEDAYYDYDKLDLGRIYDFCGDDWIFLIKMHPFISDAIPIPERCNDRIVDFSFYPNINDLYYITDLLITDYSSNYYEYALLEKPVLFYTYDREFYELTRGVHRDVKGHAPGKVCDTFDELMLALENKDYEAEKIYQFVKDNFGGYDGHASDRVIDEILLK